MKRWTANDQAKLVAMETQKNMAYSELDSDIARLMKRLNADAATMASLGAVLRSSGQMLVDMLTDHFDVSPKAAPAPSNEEAFKGHAAWSERSAS